MTNKILSMKNRGEVVFSLGARAKDFENFVWKTGTSYRRKDAWCIGFGHKYVLGIWLGNFSGQGHAGLSGIEVAAPVFQKIISQLEWDAQPLKRKNPLLLGWKTRQVCPETGLKPGPFCQNNIADYYLPMVSSQEVCRHKMKAWVNATSTLSFCDFCKPTEITTRETFDNPPPGWAQFAAQKGKTFHLPPPHNPACQKMGQESPVTFLYPMDGKIYFLDGKETVSLSVRLRAKAEDFPIRVFENGHLLGISHKGETFSINLKEGAHSLTAIGQNGNSQKINFWVRAF
jgi:penicillin-binding protein 1C